MSRTPRTWTLAALLAERTIEVGECCEWQLSMGGPLGHTPQMHLDNRCVNVRRLVHALAKGVPLAELPAQLNVWAGCGNWRCINPAHIKAGTRTQMAASLQRHQVYRQTADTVLRITATKRRTQAKLTLNQAREIRVAPGRMRDIAKAYGVSASLVSLIKAGRTWREAAGSPGLALQSAWLHQPAANDTHTEAAA